MVMIAQRAEIERKLREHQALLASIPDRGFDSARRRAEVQDDIDLLLERLLGELD